MKAYPKLILRDFKKLYSKFVAIVFIVAIGVAFLVGLLTTAPNMRHTIDKFYKDTNTADVVIQKHTPFTSEEILNISNHYLVSEVMPYFMIDEPIIVDDVYHMSRIVLLDFIEGVTMNQLTLVEGRLPELNGDVIEVVVEESQAYLLDIPIGFTTTVQGKTFEVVGIVNQPWYFAYVQEISPLSGRPIESMIYVDQTFLDETTYTNISIKLKGSKQHNSFSSDYQNFIENRIQILTESYPDYIFTTRFQNQSFVKFNSDVKIVEVISIIFPLFFFLITVLVTMSSMTRIISDQRIQIGTLRSLGYSKITIITKYIIYVLLASGIGVLLGISIGIYSIPFIAYNAYVVAYNLPPLSIEYHFMYITLISSTMILSVVVVTYFSVVNVLKEAPSNLLRHKSPKAGKKILLERFTFIWKRLKFKYKSTFRNIFRQKRNLFLMLVGISGSTALLLAGFGIKDAVELSGDAQFNQMYNFDIELGILPNETSITLIDTNEKLNLMIQVAYFDETDYINLIVPETYDELNDFLSFKDTKDKSIEFKADSVFVTKQFALDHDISVGDFISLEVNDVTSNFTVTGIVAYYFGNNIYISNEIIKDVFDLYLNKIYVKLPNLSKSEMTQLKSSLNDLDNVVHVQTKDDLMASFKQTSSSMNSVIILLVIFASVLSVIINYNLTLINISTRHKEMATLKVLGYDEKEATGYIFRETFMISSVAILIGLILGRLLQYFIISQINVDGIILKNDLYPLSYLYTAVLSIVYLLIVYVSSIPKIRKIDMLEALKSFE